MKFLFAKNIIITLIDKEDLDIKEDFDKNKTYLESTALVDKIKDQKLSENIINLVKEELLELMSNKNLININDCNKDNKLNRKYSIEFNQNFINSY